MDPEPDSVHDGADGTAIGAGDQVFRGGARASHVSLAVVKRAFETSAHGVEQAALYELHRGEARPFGEVLADSTRARFARGPAAADEGPAMNNTDAPGTPPIGRLSSAPVGPIRSYLELGGDWDASVARQLPWCGSFAAFVFARCGVDVKKGFMSAYRVPRQLSLMNGIVYLRRDTGDPSSSDVFSTRSSTYFASWSLSTVSPTRDVEQAPQSVSLSTCPIALPTPETLDVRVGDVAWLMHDRTHGHVMIVVGVRRNDHSVDLVTVEGNANNRVQHAIRTISLVGGRISGVIVGWGRPGAITDALPSDAVVDTAVADTISNEVGDRLSDV